MLDVGDWILDKLLDIGWMKEKKRGEGERKIWSMCVQT